MSRTRVFAERKRRVEKKFISLSVMQGKDYLNKYIPLQEAAKFCNYSQEYLSLRARQGKLRALKFGRNWVTKKEWLDEYLANVEEYNSNHLEVKKLGVVPDNLPIELASHERKFKLPALGLRFGFLVALVFSLLLNNIAFGKENLKNVFNTADLLVGELGKSADRFLAESEQSFKNVFEETSSLTANFSENFDAGAAKAIENWKLEIRNLARRADGYTYILGSGADNLLTDFGQSFRNVSDDLSLYTYIIGTKADEFLIDSGESVINVLDDVSSYVSLVEEKTDNFWIDASQSFVNVYGDLQKINLGMAEVAEGTGQSLKDYFSEFGRQTSGAANLIGQKLDELAQKTFEFSQKIVKGYGQANRFVEEGLKNLVFKAKDSYFTANSFIEQKLKETGKVITQPIVESLQFVASPWRQILPEKVEVQEKVKKEDIEKLAGEVESLKGKVGKEVVKEVTRITQIEPVKEITKEVTKVDEIALGQVRAQIVDLQTEVAKRLYAPGGVVSQQIYITQPVSSPKVYQENGDIVLQTLGSGNVILTAATGMQLAGKQVVIDSTAVSNPLVYIADPVRINGATDIGGALSAGPITSQRITLTAEAGNWSGNVLDVRNSGGTSKFSITETGAATLVGSLTLTGAFSQTGTLSLSTSSTQTVLTVNQSGSGNIIDFQDSGVSVFTIVDGGYATLAVAASTTPAFLVRMTEATSTFSTSTYFGVLATSTFVGRFADFVKSGSGSLFYLDSSGNLMATGTLIAGATTTLAINGGFVGIATSTPFSTEKLTVYGNVWGSGNMILSGSTGSTTIASHFAALATTTLGSATSTPTIFTGYVQSNIYPFSNLAYDLGSSTQKWRNLYVGTTTIGSTITLGSADISASGALTVRSAGDLTASSTNDLIFFTAGSERMRIDDTTGYISIGTSTFPGLFNIATSTNIFNVLTSGYIGIGTTSPASLLELYDWRANSQLTITAATSTTYDAQIAFRTGAAAPTTRFVLGVDQSDSNKFKIATGTLGTLDILSISPTTGFLAIGTDTASSLFTVATSTNILTVNSAGNATLLGDLTITGGDIGSAISSITMANAGWLGIGAAAGRIVFTDAATDELEVQTATLDLNNNLITNIGNSGSDFDANGSLTLAGSLAVSTTTGLSYFQGKLGIATTTPSEMLTVWGGAYFGTSTVPTLYVASSTGRVAVGTTSPASLFEIYDWRNNADLTITAATSSTNDPRIVFRTGASAPTSRFVLGVDQSANNNFVIATTTLGTADLFSINYASTSISIATNTFTGLFNIATSSSILTVLPGGNVGIGTTAPLAKLQTQLASNVSTIGTGAGIKLTMANTNAVGNIVELGFATYPTATRNHATIGLIETSGAGYEKGDLYFAITDVTATQDNPLERMRITSAGNVGIGTTTPASLLEVYSSTADSQFTITAATSTTYDAQIAFRTGATAPTTRFVLGVDQSDSNKFKIATGTLGTLDILSISPTTGFLAIGTDTASSLFTVATSTNILTVNSTGNVGIGTSTIETGYVLKTIGGAVCVGIASSVCPASPTGGAIYVENSVGTGNVSAFDIAEFYPASEPVEKGELVVVDPQNPGKVKKSSQAYQSNLIGAVSTEPAIVMDESNITFGKSLGEKFDSLKPYVALAGRVPVKVSLENGPIAAGDTLTSSNQPGIAMKATQAGRVIGITLEPFDGSDPDGQIMVFINPHWQGNDLTVEENNSGQIVQIDIKSELASLGLIVNENGILEVQKLKTRELCVGEVCVTEEQFRAVFGATATPPDAFSSQPEATSTPPETIIDSGPSGSTTSTEATFIFHSDVSSATFQCKVNLLDWSNCSSPREFTGLTLGDYAFQVFATDPQGNYDASPASSTWSIIE